MRAALQPRADALPSSFVAPSRAEGPQPTAPDEAMQLPICHDYRKRLKHSILKFIEKREIWLSAVAAVRPLQPHEWSSPPAAFMAALAARVDAAGALASARFHYGDLAELLYR